MTQSKLIALQELVNNLNAAAGYSNRYKVLRSYFEHTTYAIYKAEGNRDRNESGWLTYKQAQQWLIGATHGIDATKRRAARNHE